jgi:hypothetical protein
VCKASHTLPPSHCLHFVNLSVPPSRVQMGENQKKSGLDYRLGGQELSNSVFKGWWLCGQQYEGIHCHVPEEYLVYLSVCFVPMASWSVKIPCPCYCDPMSMLYYLLIMFTDRALGIPKHCWHNLLC